MKHAPQIEELKEMLRWHGYHHAASHIDTDARWARVALAEWRLYPACMDIYPKVLTKGRILA